MLTIIITNTTKDRFTLWKENNFLRPSKLWLSWEYFTLLMANKMWRDQREHRHSKQAVQMLLHFLQITLYMRMNHSWKTSWMWHLLFRITIFNCGIILMAQRASGLDFLTAHKPETMLILQFVVTISLILQAIHSHALMETGLTMDWLSRLQHLRQSSPLEQSIDL
jgi:hypothetical protein